MRSLIFLFLFICAACAHDETWTRASAPRNYRIESMGMLGHGLVGAVAVKGEGEETRSYSTTSFLPEIEAVDPKAYELAKKAMASEDSAFESIGASFGVFALCLVPQFALPLAAAAGLAAIPLQLGSMHAGAAQTYYDTARDQINETLSARATAVARLSP